MLLKLAIFIWLLFIFTLPVQAIYDPLSVPNNKFGIHILETQEIDGAAQLVNSSGGDWGYVTIPIRANERDLAKWTRFMVDARRLQIIPILRIASFPVDDHWMAPNEYDLIDFANFLNDLPWPTKNRYVIVYNETNHAGEWGGFVDPAEYARVLDRAVDIFHKSHPDFFVIAAGMDASSGAYGYEQAMNQTWPGIFDRVDGLSFHAYGNPAFTTYPNIYSRVNVASYRYEYSFSDSKPIFLTEAGWKYGGCLDLAFTNIWLDPNIVAITPFVYLAPAGPFTEFSLSDKPVGQTLKNLPKLKGDPQLSQNLTTKTANINPSWTGNPPPTSPFDLIGSLKAVFSRIFAALK